VPDTVGVVVTVVPIGPVTVSVGAPAAVKLVTSATLLPPAFVATAVTELIPAEALTTQLKLPLAEAVVLHRVVPFGPVSTTVAPGVAVPDTVGLSVVVVLRGDWIATVG
jgi:hypothetical protein